MTQCTSTMIHIVFVLIFSKPKGIKNKLYYLSVAYFYPYYLILLYEFHSIFFDYRNLNSRNTLDDISFIFGQWQYCVCSWQ